MPEFVVGIDLGTTNSTVCYFRKSGVDPEFQQLQISQLTAPGVVEKLAALPSFLYKPLPAELESGPGLYLLPGLDLEWVSGSFARDRGGEIPGRFVSSAKSWLCQAHFDKKNPILPFKSEEDLVKLSPFQATVIYLRHLAHAWRQEMQCELGEQEIVLTVPASFDEEARNLTEEAAREAGFQNLILMEEPLAALYAWLSNGEGWRKEVREGDVIFVCDVGGGTSDFSLVQVGQEDGELCLRRTAVGQHILLGGDNMDLALAYQAKARLEKNGAKLASWQMRSLWGKARKAKEDVLGGRQDVAQFTLLGSGSKLIGGTIRTEIPAAELRSFLLDGFFPDCELHDRPKSSTGAGLQELGLSFAADAAITKHVAEFLSRQSGAAGFRWPNRVLFNGGVFTCTDMQDRLLAVLNRWLAGQGQGPANALRHYSLADAVSRGAAYYGWARSGKGLRIRAGVARSYYIMVDSAMPAIPGFEPGQKAYCLVPFGMEEGMQNELRGEKFSLQTGRPARFQFMSSTCRQQDQPGDSSEDWVQDLEPTSVMELTLDRDGENEGVVPVRLCAKVTELGVLELFCRQEESGREWKLEYSVREP